MHKNSIKWSRMYIEPWQIVDRTYVSVLASRVLALLNIMLVAMTWHNVQIFMVPWGWTIQSNSSSSAIFMLPLFFLWWLFWRLFDWWPWSTHSFIRAITGSKCLFAQSCMLTQDNINYNATTIKAWRMCMSEKRNLLVMLNTFSAIFALFC